MPKDGFRSITISNGLYEKLSELGNPSTVAQTLLKSRYDERIRIRHMILELDSVPEQVKIYT